MNSKNVFIFSIAAAGLIGIASLPMLKTADETTVVVNHSSEGILPDIANKQEKLEQVQNPTPPPLIMTTVESPAEDSEGIEAEETNDFLRDQMAFLNNPELIQKRQESITRRLTDTLSTETYDWHWSNEIKEKFANSTHLLPGADQVILQNVDCRETICELQLGYENAEAKQLWAPLVRHIGKLIGSDSFTYYGKESELTKIYLSQPGEKLSLFDKTANNS